MSADLREDKVICPRGFTLKDYLRTGALQFGSGELIKLKARVSMQLAGYLAETWLSADQTMTSKGDVVTLSATVQNTWQLHFWILSQGAKITVLQPKSLRESIRTALTDAVANYA